MRCVPDAVVIADADPHWASRFEEVSDEIRAIVQTKLLGLEHIGSTAVPGLAAKPVVDVLIGVATMSDVIDVARSFEERGWELPRDINATLDDRRFVKKLSGGVRTHHAHIVVFEGEEWQRLVGFRDALIADPDLRERYERLKRDLAKRFGGEREKYTAAKSEFIEAVLANVGAPPSRRTGPEPG